LVMICAAAVVEVAATGKVPAVFIFGDSTVDVGTNNYLKHSRAKANKPYYGIDYPFSKPTGRFSNAYNIADFIVRYLGVNNRSPPPFLYLVNHDPSCKKAFLNGVNFASAGSGILDQTGNITWKEVIPLRQQIEQFASVCGNLTEELHNNQTEAAALLSKSLYIISVGSNDFFDYQLNTNNLTSEIFVANLMHSYANHLQNLYQLGARKFGILGMAPLGCLPVERAMNSSGGCMSEMNNLAQTFHQSTHSLLQRFSSQFQGVNYSHGNLFNMTMAAIQLGRYPDVESACCGNGTSPCQPGSQLCPDRTQYLFWDRFHPTQDASGTAADTLVNSEITDFVSPINLSQLAAA
jgi:phospholipase/lecithinase/hemolysin